MIHEAYLSLGTNMGNREDQLKEAVRQLEEQKSLRLLAVSSIYETDPVGFTDQPSFFNIVVKLKTSMTPDELLAACQEIENKLGRERIVRWGPRTIDLDILLYNHDNIKSDSLIIPHPRMTERAFVLIPLAEIDTAITLPGTSLPLEQYVKNVQGKEGVKLWKTADAFYRL
ncbi:2-amino-4-hydroxy-6-hydroxymethyldihydropteridine diphosphokinase [Domibacillus sp. DTU_2020_1001157_1_SI_ALB_TIR_016]|uniref:2-amino-4-hydroxy-6- hydroxymethyldihydropteridine diphosphokinase n=1 Tax=Domibacillus sp. DTU_2020_1001157_1_SI_ALB_TIR_016 TaxID=3077789 RepID=UPI0028EF319B|nr:2-amino-4-hydroxy-6-hydroxymethyldihydropteridine diphosphokinase [Domibacillus sp. DTU_2020_1001157_1_SI_ALB_TIR_016]WNS80787.1 2-amino-4-hydroxy-6-hydroxymethyldihydropteridine diphosphokinase [Domibacillus sp. DTU_2020_1001157_1_SI_ALB_TIR_016]